jgi:hypothetical protein
VTAAVNTAGVAWLAQRHTERELFRAERGKRAVAVRQLSTVNRQVRDALKLVLEARRVADHAAARAADDTTAPGPRLFGGAGVA